MVINMTRHSTLRIATGILPLNHHPIILIPTYLPFLLLPFRFNPTVTSFWVVSRLYVLLLIFYYYNVLLRTNNYFVCRRYFFIVLVYFPFILSRLCCNSFCFRLRMAVTLELFAIRYAFRF